MSCTGLSVCLSTVARAPPTPRGRCREPRPGGHLGHLPPPPKTSESVPFPNLLLCYRAFLGVFSYFLGYFRCKNVIYIEFNMPTTIGNVKNQFILQFSDASGLYLDVCFDPRWRPLVLFTSSRVRLCC